MASTDELVAILREALQSRSGRKERIGRFQQLVWNLPELDSGDEAREVFADLAYDLDYYEPDPRVRGEDPSFYGDERMEEEIREALNKLGLGE